MGKQKITERIQESIIMLDLPEEPMPEQAKAFLESLTELDEKFSNRIIKGLKREIDEGIAEIYRSTSRALNLSMEVVKSLCTVIPPFAYLVTGDNAWKIDYHALDKYMTQLEESGVGTFERDGIIRILEIHLENLNKFVAKFGETHDLNYVAVLSVMAALIQV